MTGSLPAAPSSDMEAVRLEKRTEVDSLTSSRPTTASSSN